MKKIISLNGLDNCGKTTQARKIKEHNKLVQIIGNLSKYDFWPKLDGEDLFNWWFQNGRTEEIIKTIYNCISARGQEIASSDFPLVVIDRGNRMFDAVCIATTSIRERCSLDEAERFVFDIRNKFNIENFSNENLLFQHGLSLEEMLEISSRRSDSKFSDEADFIYKNYQRLLATILQRQVKEGVYSKIVNASGNIDTIFSDIQNVIISLMTKDLDLSNLHTIIGLGGLSECGKSSLAEYLEREHGFVRLKIGYFIENISQQYSSKLKDSKEGIYDVSDDFLSTLFLEQLLRFANNHYYQKDFSIESLHNFEFTQKLKGIMDDKFKIIYIDVPEKVRIKRNSDDLSISIRESKKLVSRKDSQKKRRGAESIKNISDFVLDNSQSREYTYQQINRFLFNGFLFGIKPIDSYSMPEEYKNVLRGVTDSLVSKFDSAIHLLTVIGSGGRNNIIEGWSDLDLLLVIDKPTEESIKGVSHAVKGMPIKVGTTMYSPKEFQNGIVDSKTVYSIELIKTGILAPTIINEELQFPYISKNHRKKLHQMLLPNLIHRLRRNLYSQDDLDMHSLAKNVDNIMKFMLSKKGKLACGYIKTQETFYQEFPECPRVYNVLELMKNQDSSSYYSQCCNFIDYIINKIS